MVAKIWAVKGDLHSPAMFKLYVFQRKACSAIIPDAQKGDAMCFPRQSLL